MRHLNVLFVPHPTAEVQVPWGDHVIECIGPRHELRVFDRASASEPQFEDIEAVVDLGGNMTAEMIEIAGKAGVKFVQVQTNGLDHVAVDEILDAGMLLAHCPGELSSVALAESAMLFMLLLGARYKEAQASFATGKCFFPTGLQLEGRTLGIIGFGHSGQELARRAKAFGMKLMAIDVRPIEQEILDEIQLDFLGGAEDTDRVIAESDFLSVHLHLTPTTKHIIDARRIGLMKPTACLINVARGGLVDEEALYQALLDGRLGGAGLDAFAREPPDQTLPVYQLPNVYVTPHTGGSSDGTSQLRAQFALANLDRYARGEEVLARVTSRVA
jgi:phosphoglycerate dehydrogenase-like enzyme